jgi:hypothetical protein
MKEVDGLEKETNMNLFPRKRYQEILACLKSTSVILSELKEEVETIETGRNYLERFISTVSPEKRIRTLEGEDEYRGEEEEEEDKLETREGLTLPVHDVTIVAQALATTDDQGFSRRSFKVSFVSSDAIKYLNAALGARQLSKESQFWSEARSLPANLVMSPRVVWAYIHETCHAKCTLCRHSFLLKEPVCYGYSERYTRCTSHVYHVVCAAYLVAMMKESSVGYFCCLGKGGGLVKDCNLIAS